MKTIKNIALACAAILAGTGAMAQPKLNADNIDEVIAAMTLHEKALLVVGTGSEGLSTTNLGSQARLVPGAAGTTQAIERLGIPMIVLADGPAGLRINPTRLYDSNTYYCTHFPIGTCLSSSWNVDLVETVGAAIGNEVREYGADVLLAPGVCIHRNPLCGRNFEYYSEDPVLSGNIAAAYINGVQSQGVGTSIKHYAFNQQETARLGNDARVGIRAAREIYLKNFEIAIKKSSPWTVMSSYNGVNGRQTSERKDLITDILRGDWGYKGMVMTDWFGGTDPVYRAGKTDRAANMLALNNLIEPGSAQDTKDIEEAVKSGRLPMEQLDKNVRGILELIVKTPRFKGYAFSNKPDLKAHAQVTRTSASEGTVLLKNESGTLPFGKDIRNVALYGVASYKPIAGGTGSGDVHSSYTISLVEGMRNNGYSVDNDILSQYTTYIDKYDAEVAKMEIEWWKNKPLAPELVPSDAELAKSVAANDVAVITLQRLSGEGSDRSAKDFNLSEGERQLIAKVTEAFHKAGKKAVVVLNIGGVIESASWKDIPDAILLPWQCGQEFGNSVADILAGVQSPSGKLPMTWPVNFMDVPSSSNFPLDALEIGFEDTDLTRYKDVKNVGYTNYDEGIYVGYRYFDTYDKTVSYPFGYGLSYTTFAFSNLRLADNGDSIEVSVDIENTGKSAGKEVAEVYVKAAKGRLDKPAQELKAFAKTRQLQPGESQTLKMTVAKRDLASFSEKQSAWVVDPGQYTFRVGSSSRDIRQTASIKVGKLTEQVSRSLAMVEE